MRIFTFQLFKNADSQYPVNNGLLLSPSLLQKAASRQRKIAKERRQGVNGINDMIKKNGGKGGKGAGMEKAYRRRGTR